MTSINLLPLLVLCCSFSYSSFAQSVSASLFFDTDQTSLSVNENEKLSAFLKSLDTLQINNISITAYCDDRGSEAYNTALALKRANYIKQVLGSGALALVAHTEGKGEIGLKNKADSIAERRHNRRADLTANYIPKVKTDAEMPAVTAVTVTENKKPVTEAKEPILNDNQKVGDKITLKNILFAGGRHILLPESYESLESLKNLLLEKKKYHIMILGHICCITSGEDGMDFDTGKQNLSVARARAVYNYLVENGVSPGRLSYKGMRARYPTGRSDREDRRVEIEITKIVEE